LSKPINGAVCAIEKITRRQPEFLAGHKKELLTFLAAEAVIELKWHLAQLLSRLSWEPNELTVIWDTLMAWAEDKKESKIVRANSIQALFDLSGRTIDRREELEALLDQVQAENVPSLNARIRKLRKTG